MPIAKLMTTITPKCIGSTPARVAIDVKTAERMIIAAILSIKHPIKRNIALSNKSNRYLLLVMLKIDCTILGAIISFAIIQPNKEATATTNMTTAVDLTEP